MVHLILKIILNKFLVSAATPSPLELGTFEGIGKLGGQDNNLTNQITAVGTFITILSNIIGVMTIVAIIWFTFVLFTGAIAWLGSGGDKTRLQGAQKQITTGLIGLVIVIAAIFIIRLIGDLIGIPDILSLAGTILELRP